MPTDPLDDKELNAMLQEWKTPGPPPHLRAALFPEAPWWKRVLLAEIRIPVPVAACLVVLLLAAIWMYRPAPATLVQAVTFRELQPVKEFKPRIIRRAYVQE
jgi:hypothetical protein